MFATFVATTSQISRKQQIIEAAAVLFRDKGYTASTMRDLADAVGIEAASLYNHINSKEEILGIICQLIAEKFTQSMDELESSNLSATNKVESLIDLHISITTEYAPMAAVANDEWRHLKEPLYSDFIKLRDSYEHRFLKIIETGIANTELRGKNGETILYTILSSVRWLQYWYRPDRALKVEELKEQITQLIMKGLKG